LFLSTNTSSTKNLPLDERSKDLHQLMIQADEDDNLEDSLRKVTELFESQTKYRCNIFQNMLGSIQIRENTMVPINDEQGRQIVLYKKFNLLYNLSCYLTPNITIAQTDSCFQDIPVTIQNVTTAFLTENNIVRFQSVKVMCNKEPYSINILDKYIVTVNKNEITTAMVNSSAFSHVLSPTINQIHMDYVHDPIIAEQKNTSDTSVQFIDDGNYLFQVTHIEQDTENVIDIFGIKVQKEYSFFYGIMVSVVVIIKVISVIIIIYIAYRILTCMKSIFRNTKKKNNHQEYEQRVQFIAIPNLRFDNEHVEPNALLNTNHSS